MYIKKYIFILEMHCFFLTFSLAACPSNEWLLNDGICYLADAKITRSWDAAVSWCIDRNSLLVYPKTYTEKTFLFSYLISKRISSCWIGLDDKQTEGTYVWQDTTVLQPSEEGWNSVNPDSEYPDDDCIELWPEGWNDAGCSWDKNVICQVNEEIDTTTTTTSTDTPTTSTDTPTTSTDTPTTSTDTPTTSTDTLTTVEMSTITTLEDLPSSAHGYQYCKRDFRCLGDSLILSTDTKSIIYCGWKCLNNPSCCSFVYNTTNHMCGLLTDSTSDDYFDELYFIKC